VEAFQLTVVGDECTVSSSAGIDNVGAEGFPFSLNELVEVKPEYS